MAISRKDSFTIQLLQHTDALLVWFAFWIAGTFRAITGFSGPNDAVPDSINWVPPSRFLSPLVLEGFGFYNRLEHRSGGKAAWQLIRALSIVVLVVGTFAIFAKVTASSHLVLGLGLVFIFHLLLLRD
jgi:hypothetical protein